MHLLAGLTEIGTLELWCVSESSDERWRLEFELRGASSRGEVTVTESMPARFTEAREAVERIYGHKPLPAGPKDVKQLLRTLEKGLGPKETWRLPVLRELGTRIAARLEAAPSGGGPWAWALGRLGARVPLHGSGHRVVEPEVAARWLSLLLKLGLSKVEGAPFAVVQLSRATGDRTRDLADEAREAAASALRSAGAPAGWLRSVTEVVALEAADEARALGDTLPAGLTLAAEG